MKKCISLSLALVSFLGMGSLSPVWSDDDTVSAQEFAAVEQEAHKGLKASMYQLGYLYQNGFGRRSIMKKLLIGSSKPPPNTVTP